MKNICRKCSQMFLRFQKINIANIINGPLLQCTADKLILFKDDIITGQGQGQRGMTTGCQKRHQKWLLKLTFQRMP